MSTQPSTNRIKIANPPVEDETIAYLSSDTAAAATTVNVVSTTGFLTSGVDDYYVMIGQYGDSKAEIKLVDASECTATTFDIAAATYSHESSDVAILARYNQIQVFGAIASGGTKVLITTIDIDTTENFTEYTYEGTTYAYFYTAYYNSNDDEISAYSDEITSTSFGRSSTKRIIDSGLIKALTEIDETGSGKLTWDTCLTLVQDGLDEIMTRKRIWQFLHTIATDSTVSGESTIDKPSNLASLEFIMIDNRKVNWVSRMEYDLLTSYNTVVTTGKPTVYTEKNGEYHLFPEPTDVDDIRYEYFRKPTVVDGLSDEVPSEFTTILVYYCASQMAYIRGNDKRGDKMYTMFKSQLEQQVIEYSGPWQSGDGETAENISILNLN